MRRRYFVLGLATTGLCFGLLFGWDTLAHRLLEPNQVPYDRQPGWFPWMLWLVGHLPWLVGLALLLLRLTGRREIRLGAYALGAFLPSAGFALWILSESSVSNWMHAERFDPAEWQEPADTAEVFWPTRLRMVDDLLDRNLLARLTRDSVRTLLGPPNGEPGDSASIFHYYLGPERGWMRIDSEELVIRFDAEGRVMEARTVTD